MSGVGRPDHGLDTAKTKGLRVGVVATRWHHEVVDMLLERALDAAARAETAPPTVVRVPGALEIGVVAQQLAATHDAVVALGAVIRGGTPHFEYVSESMTTALTRVALDARVPVGNGVLTCDTVEQALDRCGRPGAVEDKGAEAMDAALATAVVLRELRTPVGTMGFAR